MENNLVSAEYEIAGVHRSVLTGFVQISLILGTYRSPSRKELRLRQKPHRKAQIWTSMKSHHLNVADQIKHEYSFKSYLPPLA